jgi:hypothetical protein
MANPGQENPTDAGLKAQLKRLSAYHGYDELKYELLRVLRTNASSGEHVERIVTRILDTRRPNENGFISCPTPAEMIDYAQEVPPRLNQTRPADKHCPICGGSGWCIVVFRGMSGADRCPCTHR